MPVHDIKCYGLYSGKNTTFQHGKSLVECHSLSMSESKEHHFSVSGKRTGGKSMPEKEVHSAAGEVQNSLDSIAEMERAALQRAIPSPWLGAAIGL